MLVIVNYGVGNLASIFNMLKKIGVPAVIGNTQQQVRDASKIILPGIGHFDYCMQELKKSDFYDTLHEKVLNEKVPVLGICVGSQMLMETSEEGNEAGLGWIKGKVKKFQKDELPSDHKIPHMSWSDVHPKGNQPLYEGIDQPRFYFVHSYYIDPADGADVTATADYGRPFTASVGHGHIQGVQFHPEKSHRFGMQLYSNFAQRF
ncbi:MAG TPA: imidazole glycerol phosphate synthase subunit HisH [Chitinophagaceae bacterium]